MTHRLATGCTLAGQYTIERELGHGGMATVYKATDRRHGRPVAIKVLNPELAAVMGVERFLKEIVTTSGLAHPNIVAVLDSGEWDGLPFFVMPYIDGYSLEQGIARERRLPIEEALRIAREVADALAYAHDEGVIHRDIKPANILLHAGHVMVVDFGIARAIERATGEQGTASGLVLGTVDYMSQEQIANSPRIDGRTDIYSLGCVLFEMITGVTPQAVSARYRSMSPRTVRRLRRDAPTTVSAAIVRALEPEPANRFPSARAFAEALAEAQTTLEPRAVSRRIALIVALAAVCVSTGVALWQKATHGQKPRPAVDRNLVAVAPFYVASSDPALRAWKDHLALIVQQRLDGIGPLRALSPSVATHDWPGISDRASALALGERTGAGLVTFGTLLETGASSYRVNVEILDVARDVVVDEVEAAITGEGELDQLLAQLSDSLAYRLLGRLGDRTRVAAVGRGAFGCSSSSWPAVRAYLRGEQYYRRTMWDSATTAYMDAIAIDSTCALAYRRVGIARGWAASDGDSVVLDYKLRAGANNHGLTPRDSLLVAADSISAAVQITYADSAAAPLYWSRARRLFATLEEAARRYPGDPEVWYALGDAGYHFGWGPTSTTPQAMLDAFDRAIALDSGFAPSYLHAVEIGFAVGGDSLALRYARLYLATNPTDVNAEAVRIVVAMADSAATAAPTMTRTLDSASADALASARLLIDLRRDSLEGAVRLSERLAARNHTDSSVAPGHCQEPRPTYARRLGRRGHLRGAACALATRTAVRLYAEAALLGGVPEDSARREFDRWLESGSSVVTFALPWWSERSDTARIARVLDRARRVMRAHTDLRDWYRAAYDSAAALAYLALARHDDAALERFTTLPDTLCLKCFDLDRLKTAQLLASAGRLVEARAIVEEWRGPYEAPADMLFAFELGRITEQLGDIEAAASAYRAVVETWSNADGVLQPLVSEARDAIKRLEEEQPRIVRVPARTRTLQ